MVRLGEEGGRAEWSYRRKVHGAAIAVCRGTTDQGQRDEGTEGLVALVLFEAFDQAGWVDGFGDEFELIALPLAILKDIGDAGLP